MKRSQLIYYSEYFIVAIISLIVASFFNINRSTNWVIGLLLLASVFLNRLSPYSLGLNQSRKRFLKLAIFESVLMALVSIVVVALINLYDPNRIFLFTLKIDNQLPLLIFFGLVIATIIIISFSLALQRYDQRVMSQIILTILLVMLPLVANNSGLVPYGELVKQLLNDAIFLIFYIVQIRIFNYYLKLANLYKDPDSKWHSYQ
ncbi:hypothetical protein [Holzapfeliella floricola]|uniref:hypothetical protein n=1 Tax=Holzapfeliella floricola TaxID=679249 RepID=UPI000784D7F9|nr:hypothetical protein [Holzapfeliella floricola]